MIPWPSWLDRVRSPYHANEGDRSLYFGRLWVYGAIALLLIDSRAEPFSDMPAELNPLKEMVAVPLVK